MFYPSYVKDVVLRFLQLTFSEEFYVDDTRDIDQLEDIDNKQPPDRDPRVEGNEPPFINRYIWKPKQDETEIHIADAYTENMEQPEFRPAIIVQRGTMRWNNTGIDQMQGQTFGDDTRTYTDLVVGDLTINCISRTGLEAELLANICFQIIQFFARVIRQKTKIFAIKSVAIGQEALVQSDSKQDITIVPVGIQLYVQDRWKLRNPGDLISKIDVLLSAGGLKQATEVNPVGV